MKKLLLLLLSVTAFFTHAFAQNIVGEWSGKKDGESAVFIFDAEGFATMKMDGGTLGGKSFLVHGIPCAMKYTFNATPTPHHLDFLVYDLKTGNGVQRLYCIAQFLGPDKLKICMNVEDATRPKNFSNQEDVVVLSRKK
jgi:hypothetical protein